MKIASNRGLEPAISTHQSSWKIPVGWEKSLRTSQKL